MAVRHKSKRGSKKAPPKNNDVMRLDELLTTNVRWICGINQLKNLEEGDNYYGLCNEFLTKWSTVRASTLGINGDQVLSSAFFIVKSDITNQDDWDAFCDLHSKLPGLFGANDVIDDSTHTVIYAATDNFLQMFDVDFLHHVAEKGLQHRTLWTPIPQVVKEYFVALTKTHPIVHTVELISVEPIPEYRVRWRLGQQTIYCNTRNFKPSHYFDPGDHFGLMACQQPALIGRRMVHFLGVGAATGDQDNQVVPPPDMSPSYFSQTVVNGNACAYATCMNLLRIIVGESTKCEFFNSTFSSSADAPSFKECRNQLQKCFQFHSVMDVDSGLSAFDELSKCHMGCGLPVIALVQGQVLTAKSHCIGILFNQLVDGSRSSTYPFSKQNLNYAMGKDDKVTHVLQAWALVPKKPQMRQLREIAKRTDPDWTFNHDFLKNYKNKRGGVKGMKTKQLKRKLKKKMRKDEAKKNRAL